jgi:hypothetical protein
LAQKKIKYPKKDAALSMASRAEPQNALRGMKLDNRCILCRRFDGDHCIEHATMIVQARTSSEFDRCSVSGLIWELKDLLLCNFVTRIVTHNPRSVAHVIWSPNLSALGASLSPGTISVRDSIPACIQVLVTKDLALVITSPSIRALDELEF